jgi:hypothetical protein
MAQQESEDGKVPKISRKGGSTRRVERAGGGKAVPVNEQANRRSSF